MDRPDSPKTPLHVLPDEEVSLPEGTFEDSQMDLNPDLDNETPEAPSTSIPISYRLDPSDGSSSNGLLYQLWTLPFDEALERLESTTKGSSLLTLSQQSKFITYIDDQLLQIQRAFIKNQAETKEVYSLRQLLTDLHTIVDLIWCLINPKSSLFGQEEYFVRILGDLEDWVGYYDLRVLDPKDRDSIETLKSLFVFFQVLDTRLLFLMDGYPVDDTSVCKMSTTEIVRLAPIVARIRLSIVNRLENSRLILSRNAPNDPASRIYMNILEMEVGRLMEGTIERL